MRRAILYLTLLLLVSALPMQGALPTSFPLKGESKGVYSVECGSWLELSATPAEDYHFVRWSDGSTDSIHQVQVNEDATYIAFFAANCEEYANWPVVALYDWLLMLNVKEIKSWGYYVNPEQVTWYRVVGEPDDMHNAFPQDDQLVCKGYYLTLAKNLWGTGDYYCVADASSSQGTLCDGLMRSEIVHFAGTKPKGHLMLVPSVVSQGDQVQIKGLFPDEESDIRIYDATGKLISTLSSRNETVYALTAAYAAGCYLIRVHSDSFDETLRFIVTH